MGMVTCMGLLYRCLSGTGMGTATQHPCPYLDPEAWVWITRGGYPQTLAHIPPLCMSTIKIILASPLHITPSYQHNPRQIEHMIYMCSGSNNCPNVCMFCTKVNIPSCCLTWALTYEYIEWSTYPWLSINP